MKGRTIKYTYTRWQQMAIINMKLLKIFMSFLIPLYIRVVFN